ncbi:hypothetical protein [Micromonospora inyonensis]|uniref:hypothetical protein n=1 Tax=Micromonospora inyonensis TaxID=47866 RepID=UPI000B8095BA|nr:hypothetical protein [Micromonospora inyonensis]
MTCLTLDGEVDGVMAIRAGAASAVSEMSYELGVALGIALLGTLHIALYRAGLPDLSGLPGPAREAVADSLAAGTRALSGTGEQGTLVLDAAGHAFAHGMRITSVIAAVLLLVAALVAWKVIPSDRRRARE